MTGPEHYREAERFIGIALDGERLHTPEMRQRLATIAQAHATLALAAATALGLGRADDHGMVAEDANAWIKAASEWQDGATR